ncbi:hypothetical protein E2P81_ATG03111 [Venturia nashicola]|nr:hypothetical protein E2P81_ATG03111 [Venturia nashicola]
MLSPKANPLDDSRQIIRDHDPLTPPEPLRHPLKHQPFPQPLLPDVHVINMSIQALPDKKKSQGTFCNARRNRYDLVWLATPGSPRFVFTSHPRAAKGASIDIWIVLWNCIAENLFD